MASTFHSTSFRPLRTEHSDNVRTSRCQTGMWYRKTLNITAQQAAKNDIILNLGDLVSTTEVYLNSELIGQKVCSPWTFNLAGKLKTGENKLEILVYNTLGNHYLTTPSKYVGRTKSGLIGPVTIQFQ